VISRQKSCECCCRFRSLLLEQHVLNHPQVFQVVQMQLARRRRLSLICEMHSHQLGFESRKAM
jgi:hypothetical protein